MYSITARLIPRGSSPSAKKAKFALSVVNQPDIHDRTRARPCRLHLPPCSPSWRGRRWPLALAILGTRRPNLRQNRAARSRAPRLGVSGSFSRCGRRSEQPFMAGIFMSRTCNADPSTVQEPKVRRTLCWREVDSNFRFRARSEPALRSPKASSLSSSACRTSAACSRISGPARDHRSADKASDKHVADRRLDGTANQARRARRHCRDLRPLPRPALIA